jgi:hypothetical protein
VKGGVVCTVQQGRGNSDGSERLRYARAIQQLRFCFHGAGFGRSIAQSISTRGRRNDSDNHQSGDGDAGADSEECLDASEIKGPVCIFREYS